MAKVNVSLPKPMKLWVEAQARNGSYANTSDYFRALVRRDQEHAQALCRLQKLVDEGIASGPAEAFDLEEFLVRKHRSLAVSGD